MNNEQMKSYEAARQKQFAQASARMTEHVERLTWPVERLRLHRQRELRRLVQFARERSPWHGRRLAHLDTEQLGEETMSLIPIMTKDDLMANFDEILTDGRLGLLGIESHLEGLTTDAFLLDQYHAVASSGSSGRRGVFVFDWDGWITCYLGFVRHLARHLREIGARSDRLQIVACIGMEKSTHMSSALPQTFHGGNTRVERFFTTTPLERTVEGLNNLQPGILEGYPSVLHTLAREAHAGRLRIKPEHLILYAEPLSPEAREALESAWDARIWNMWAISEGGAAGSSCARGAWMHLSDDLLIIEAVDEKGRPVPPGTRSARVYLTNLFNFTLPLIRYELTDEVTLLDGACPCGSTHGRIADIQGRSDESFIYKDNLIVHPSVLRSPLGRERNIAEYQVRQTERGADVSIRCLGPVNTARLEEKIRGELLRLGLPSPEVKVETVERLERGATGKLKLFFPLRAPR